MRYINNSMNNSLYISERTVRNSDLLAFSNVRHFRYRQLGFQDPLNTLNFAIRDRGWSPSKSQQADHSGRRYDGSRSLGSNPAKHITWEIWPLEMLSPIGPRT